MFVDAHCHLTGDEYQSLGGADGVIARAKANGVGIIVASGFDLESSFLSAQIANRHDGVYFSAGFHPSEIGKMKDGDLIKLKQLCTDEKCVAVGEIGLDYHFDDNPSKEKQKQAFLDQLLIADELGLPIVVHSRDACADTLELLQAHATLLKRGGLMHCYSYSAESVRDFSALGFSFSFGGTATFKNAKKVQESVKAVAKDRLISETDCPYLSPEPLRGRFPNLPENVAHVTKMLALLREEEWECVQKTILANVKRLFFKIGE